MQLQTLAAEPKLEKITVDHAAIIEKYGESLDFYMYDRQDMDTFMKLASIDASNQGEIFSVIKSLVRDDQGNLILQDKATLPVDVMVRVIEKVVERLGKLQSQTTAE
jgi:hypothetical protein